MKSRGMDHSKEVREFIISSSGINLIPIARNKQGILIGSKRVAAEKESKKEADKENFQHQFSENDTLKR
jgi:circadian clock protein KaiC